MGSEAFSETFTDWHLESGSPFDGLWLAGLYGMAGLVLLLALLGLRGAWPWRQKLTVFAMRAGATGLCLLIALQIQVRTQKVQRLPNHIAVLVDSSKSMSVRPASGERTRFERVRDKLSAENDALQALARKNHNLSFFTFDETLNAVEPRALGQGPSGHGTHLGEVLSDLQTRFAGRSLAGVVLLTDGIDNGRLGPGPIDSQTQNALAALAAPVHTLLVGESAFRDLSVTTSSSENFAFVRTPIKIDAIVRHTGLPGRQVEVRLAQDGRPIASKSLPLSGESAETRLSFDFTPDKPGSFVFELSTPVLEGEALTSNNRHVFSLKVIRDRVRILHVAGRPSWDQRFLRSLLRLNPNVDLVSFFILRTITDQQTLPSEMSLIPFPDRQIFKEQLHSFDLLVFQDFNYAPYNVGRYLRGIRDYVEGGGALAMVGGDLSFASGGYADSPLSRILPVDLSDVAPTSEAAYSTDAFRPRLTTAGQTHPVTALHLAPETNRRQWQNMPPLAGINRVTGLRPGATTLLSHPTEKTSDGSPAPVVAVAEVGEGRTLALTTDTSWQWAFHAAGAGDDTRNYQKFWENSIRWLVQDPNLTHLRLDLDRSAYPRFTPINVRVRALAPDFSPAPNIPVALTLSRADRGKAAGELGNPPADGAGVIRRSQVTTNAGGEAQLNIKDVPAGAYVLEAEADIGGRTARVRQTLVVREATRELSDVAPREGLLRDISQRTGGFLRRRWTPASPTCHFAKPHIPASAPPDPRSLVASGVPYWRPGPAVARVEPAKALGDALIFLAATR